MKKITLLIGFLIITIGLFSQNNSQFISQTGPSSVDPGEIFTISVSYKNTGTTAWVASKNYRMGSQNLQDNLTWRSENRVELPNDVAPGEEVTFTVELVAPEFGNAVQWQMVQDGTGWFGERSEIMIIRISYDSAMDSLLMGNVGFSLNNHIVGTFIFHWYGPGSWQYSSPWIPIEGRTSWAGDVRFWKRMVKQMMAANIDVLYILVIPTMEQQRINLFRALFELRREGWDVPKVSPFFDTLITYDLLGYHANAATEDGKNEFVSHYIRFYNQYFSQNPDEFADDYIYTQDGIPVLNIWHVHITIDNYTSLTRGDIESRLSAEFGSEHSIFNNGIKMIAQALSPTFSWVDEQAPQFEAMDYHIDKECKGITTAYLKPGYWDQNVRNPGQFLPRNGGIPYAEAWSELSSEINRVTIESFNEYDEGTGIYATKTDTVFARIDGNMNNTNTDTWSSTNDPYEYIKTTAKGAEIFNDDEQLGAKILWHNIPEEMSRAETFTATVLVRNTGNESWNDVKGFKFGEQESLDPVLFGLARYSIDDAQDDIPTYGGIFRGRVKTFEIEITAPDISSEYLTHWGMVQDQDSWFGDTIELPISVLQSYHTTEDIKLCSGDSILWNGDFYSQTGSYYDSSFTASGHDSICQLNISVISIDPSVSHFKERFKANYAGAIYQWIDCATSEAIEGETSQYFTATENGDYAVVITEGGCVDTSLCYGVSGLGIKDVNEKANQFKSYPNPVSIHGILNIDGDFRKNDRLIIISINGSLVYEESILSDTKNFSFSPESIKMHEGFYVIQIISDSSIQTKKILVRK